MNDVKKIFESQLVEEAKFMKTVIFILISKNHGDKVINFPKKNLEEIFNTYDFVEVKKKSLPRFKRKDEK